MMPARCLGSCDGRSRRRSRRGAGMVCVTTARFARVGAQRLDAVEHDGHLAQAIELVEHDHHGPGLVLAGLMVLQRGEEGRRRRAGSAARAASPSAARATRVDAEGPLADRAEVEVGCGRGPVDGRVAPLLEPRGHQEGTGRTSACRCWWRTCARRSASPPRSSPRRRTGRYHFCLSPPEAVIR